MTQETKLGGWGQEDDPEEGMTEGATQRDAPEEEQIDGDA